MNSPNIAAVQMPLWLRSARLGLWATALVMAALVLAFFAVRAQITGTTTGYYFDNFDQYGNSTSTTTIRLNGAQTGGSAYYVSGNAPSGGDNGRMAGPWERSNRPIGSANTTPFVMFWTDSSGPSIGTTVAARTYYSFQVPVEANSRYRLTYRYGLLNRANPPILQTYVNGTKIDSDLPTTTAYNSWQTATHVWASGSNTTMTVALVNNNGNRSQGNDFAIDDVLLVKVADLAVTKSDGITTLTRNSSSTYTINVSHGATSSPVAGAILSDPATSGLTINSISCAAVANNVCVTPPSVSQLQSGTFAMPNIPLGSIYQIAVNATATTTGTSITNSASISMPTGVEDTVAANNSASDTNMVAASSANLGISKTDNATTVSAGGTNAYVVTVSNAGPNAVAGAILKDAAATGLTKTSVICGTTPGQCTAATIPTIAQLEGTSGYALPVIASGQSYQIIINTNVTATSGIVSNNATITAPTGTTDSVTGNNSATDTSSIQTNTVTLRKIWVNPIPNDTVNLSISGGSGATNGTSQAGAPTETTASATANAGATITLAEAFSAGSAGSYSTSFACTRNSDGTNVATSGSGLSRTMTMPAASVTCTFTNSRSQPSPNFPPAWSGVKTCPATNAMTTNRVLQAGWNHNWPADNIDADEGAKTDFATYSQVMPGPGITYQPYHTAGVARLVDTTSAAAAFAAGDYVDYRVTTGTAPVNRALYAIRYGVNNENQWVNGYPFTFTVLISTDPTFATAQTILSNETTIFNTSGQYQPYTVPVAGPSRVLLQNNTSYYFRVLLYSTNAQPVDYDTAIWDDFAITTADCLTQNFQLAKSWTGGTAGHKASATTTGAANNATFTATAPTAATGTAVTAYQGEVITLPAETYSAGATAALYNSTVTCTGGSPLASGAVGRTVTIQNNATATVCTYNNAFVGPLTIVKTSAPYWDPVNATSNPKNIPGAYVNYSLLVTSPAISATSNSVFVTDTLPSQVDLCVAATGQCSAPVVWAAGSSGLTYTYGGLGNTSDDVEFSTDGTNWGYTPTPNANGIDPAVRYIRVNPKGSMNQNSNFTITLRTVVR